MFDEQELLTLSYGLVSLLSELDSKRRKGKKLEVNE